MIGSNRTGTTKLTPERADRIVALLKAGQDRVTACSSVGISERSLREWMTQGERGDERFVEFARRVREAEAECETRAVVQIQVKGKDDWRALAWWLERRFPLRWGDAKAASARVDAERETILDALQRALEARGLGDATEDVLRELAGRGADEASGAIVEPRQSH